MEQETNQGQYKQFNKLLIIFCLILVLTSIVFYTMIAIKINSLNKNQKNDDLPVFEETIDFDSKTSYILKEYNGKIGIFENEALIYTLDTYIFTLPEKDKKLLKDGIEVSTKEELYELIEEYY